MRRCKKCGNTRQRINTVHHEEIPRHFHNEWVCLVCDEVVWRSGTMESFGFVSEYISPVEWRM
jgi:hypothetical protein